MTKMIFLYHDRRMAEEKAYFAYCVQNLDGLTFPPFRVTM